MTTDNIDGGDGAVVATDGINNPSVYQTVHDLASNDSLCVSLVEAVAEAKGVDPLDLRETLYDSVDPDALDSLFQVDSHGAPRTDGSVTLQLCGCRVVVQSTGLIRVFDSGR